MKDVAFGQYYPTKSYVHNLDPRLKIVFLIAYIVAIFLAKNFYGLACCFLVLALAIGFSRVPVLRVFKAIKGILFLIVFTTVLNLLFYNGETVYAEWWIFTITKEGILFSIFLVIRLVLLITCSSLLTYTKAGRFISRVSFPDWNARCVIALDDSLMLLNITNERIGQYTYHIFNKYTGKEMKAFGQVQRVNQMSFWLKEFLYRYDGKILWHGFQTMNIYEVKRDTAVVRYTINVDNRTPPRDFWWKAEGKDGFQLTIDYMDKNYIGHIPFYVESDESILLYFDGGKDKNKDYAFIDKVTRETKVIERFVFDDGLAYDPEVLYSIADGWCAILIYPEHNATVYLPRGFSGEREKLIFRAAHADPDATIYWHLDDRFLGQTGDGKHEIALDIKPGKHLLTLLDNEGNQRKILFTVVTK